VAFAGAARADLLRALASVLRHARGINEGKNPSNPLLLAVLAKERRKLRTRRVVVLAGSRWRASRRTPPPGAVGLDAGGIQWLDAGGIQWLDAGEIQCKLSTRFFKSSAEAAIRETTGFGSAPAPSQTRQRTGSFRIP
jgi:hypothetical protein